MHRPATFVAGRVIADCACHAAPEVYTNVRQFASRFEGTVRAFVVSALALCGSTDEDPFRERPEVRTAWTDPPPGAAPRGWRRGGV